MKAFPPNLRAFTSVELLVSVAVVFALAVGLFAGFRMVSTGMLRTRCLANLRQLHVGVMAYAAEHSGEVPVDRVSVENGTNWYMALLPYVHHPGYGSKKGVYICPAIKTKVGWTNYALNNRLYVGGTNLGKAPEGEGRPGFLAARSAMRFSSVSGQKVLILDAMGATGGTWYLVGGGLYDPTWGATYAVHGKGVNAIFVDGSARSICVEPRNINARKDLNEMRADWFWPLN